MYISSKTYIDKVIIIILLFLLSFTTFASNQIDIVGPKGSGSFGTQILILPNGNFVVSDPNFDSSSTLTDVGAVYLYDGRTRQLISTITGTKKNDLVGSSGIILLETGNYLILSPRWDNNSLTNAGAITFGNQFTGVSGTVSANNSLVGSNTNDSMGFREPMILSNGNYLVINPG